ncbi:Kinase, NEK [Giardia duodenalis]|uniref:non-specific serine/threonine protein kinase n=1 Tax=Giardia intestinalis (strain ATCC 50803 / WB clone C6) TaxID=184922 RepID=A8B8Y7_GIAIC|nr:Kinase, NEK [Giardia intestinalis]KAE8302367.1 Kinase, NEK [Giardia intestinalis]|eukprot:XP_001708720.1 Kinase, NEK [Giardia lamblia ATCC 50803]
MRAAPPGAAPTAPRVSEFTFEQLRGLLGNVLGRGAMGTVYALRGYQGLAVKEIRLDSLNEKAIDALMLELDVLPGLHHPGVLRYHQVIKGNDLVYIVMDRHSRTLNDLVIECKQGDRPISVTMILSSVRQLVAALAYLHSVSGVGADGHPYQGLVHRDLKPANVLISKKGKRFIIADFGLCKDALRCGSTYAGTPLYMAPETLIRNKTSPASDVWSLGVILYELTTLRRPDFLGGKEPAEVFIDGWRPDLSGVTDGFIKSVLERIFVLEPERRPTARELCEMLRQ